MKRFSLSREQYEERRDAGAANISMEITYWEELQTKEEKAKLDVQLEPETIKVRGKGRKRHSDSPIDFVIPGKSFNTYDRSNGKGQGREVFTLLKARFAEKKINTSKELCNELGPLLGLTSTQISNAMGNLVKRNVLRKSKKLPEKYANAIANAVKPDAVKPDAVKPNAVKPNAVKSNGVAPGLADPKVLKVLKDKPETSLVTKGDPRLGTKRTTVRQATSTMVPGLNYKLGFALTGNQKNIFKIINEMMDKHPEGVQSSVLCSATANLLGDVPGNISSQVSIFMKSKVLAIAA